MSEDPSNVPRRLRRFYRNGQPIPEMENTGKKSNPPQPVEDKSPEDEPWMNPPKNVPRHIQRKTITATKTITRSTETGPPRGLFEKINESAKQGQGIPHLDKTLGLQKKTQIIETLPAQSDKALQTTPPNADVQAALNKLKELASKTNESASSFHFTPIGSAPAPVESAKINEKTNPPIAGNTFLSPRERMEARRQRGGEPPEGSPRVISGRPTEEMNNGPTEMSPATAAHIRRRMGQRTDSSRDEMAAEESTATPSSPAEEADTEDFKSLFGDDKKKKKKNKGEDDDLGLGDDMPLFDDEK